ncbi:hypothetical protein [Kitasatospora sp. NBC_01302]|uniref:hypothetical protein n=1 Tax=Kitasatospora sp. NBC_01302 TaxID=2903575 RepID=UPI002E1458D8|nr:hypothetical protein OG294_13880 [Kitasatospora sp. NBC_01302]
MLALLTLISVGVVCLFLWAVERDAVRAEVAERQGPPLTADEEHEWAAITARLNEDQQRRD